MIRILTPAFRSILLLLLFFSFNGKAQVILPHEKELSHPDQYLFQDIDFKVAVKKDSITLYGTLVMPKGNFDKLVIIVPGTGADTRYSHFLLTEALLQNNIAVYRYDDRGIGQSGGKYNAANTTVTMLSVELYSAIRRIKALGYTSGKKLGLIGHSQGGMVTMGTMEMGASVDFLIQWATAVEKYGAFIKYQILSGQNSFDDALKYNTTEEKFAVMDALHKVVEENRNDEDWPLSKKLNKASKKIGYDSSRYTRFPYLTLSSEKDFVRKNFEPAYQSLKIPTLYIVGIKDTFVSAEAETKVLESFNNDAITIVKMDGLTHYLTQPDLTPETMYQIDPAAVRIILNWITEKVDTL
ncbi:alpha/beta hydrolase [Flavobacterium kingsejongi]|uniref:Serine aminopeptidase S33 domain-containing protein n=1 Tax=Flavobacterium kingsejongi TaxID=1678728 RepID=A0A2S1LQY7_9FLAO|nr:alpha/beta hydrolase [Flavobacterium kingsejongi]AWG26056.1 hypothetical protein FK004_12895 [Flavobacterium kingsejongi]